MELNGQLTFQMFHPLYPFDGRMGGPQSHSEVSDEEKKFPFLPLPETVRPTA